MFVVLNVFNTFGPKQSELGFDLCRTVKEYWGNPPEVEIEDQKVVELIISALYSVL